MYSPPHGKGDRKVGHPDRRKGREGPAKKKAETLLTKTGADW